MFWTLFFYCRTGSCCNGSEFGIGLHEMKTCNTRIEWAIRPDYYRSVSFQHIAKMFCCYQLNIWYVAKREFKFDLLYYL
jgi:hypothetical protein